VRGGLVCIAAVAVLLLAACGGGGNSSSQLSPAAYRAQLAKIKQQSARAQAQVAQGLQAKRVAELRHRLVAFAASTQHIGDEVANLHPPKNAEAANTELARGLHDTARATRAASKQIASLHTPQAAISYLEHSLGNAKGAHEVDHALAKLKSLGYTTGS
jgi:cytochrome c556